MKTKDVKYSSKLCQDDVFGQLKQISANRWMWFSIHNKRYKKLRVPSTIKEIIEVDNKNPKILLVLESPHRAEYKEDGSAICPANGSSGKNIYNYLCNLFNDIGNLGKKNYINSCNTLKNFLQNNKDKIIDIWIVNSIQKQCSLGIEPINNIIKESNWIDEWCSSQNDLIKRCENIIGNMEKQNYFIINLCTRGIYIPMKQLVENEFVSSNSFNCFYCKGPHPSSWNRLKRIELV